MLGTLADNEGITIQATSPDITFAPPPRPSDWSLSETDQSAPTYYESSPWRVPPLVGATLLTAVAIPAAVWLTRRARGHRGAFARELERLERHLEANSKDPAADGGVCEGGLKERAREANRRVRGLSGLIEAGHEADGTCPWVAREQRSSKRLEACSLGLSQTLERMKCALEELRVMVEVQRLLGRLERGVGSSSVGEQRDSSEQGQEWGTSSDEEELDCRRDGGGACGGRNGGAGVTPAVGGKVSRRRRGHWGGSSPGVDGGLSPRLFTRVKALAERSDGGAANQATRCVFRPELKEWSAKLASREREAVDRLKFGLQKWDLPKVDEALAQLRLLELTELAGKFEDKKEDTRSKVWRLKEELKVSREGSCGVLWGLIVPGRCQAESNVFARYFRVLRVKIARIGGASRPFSCVAFVLYGAK